MTLPDNIHECFAGTWPFAGGWRHVWSCVCGTASPISFSSRGEAVMHFETTHHPDRDRLDHVPPEHTPSFYDGGFGGPAWSCSCGVVSRPEGHPNDRRARQSHTAHRNKELKIWYSRLQENRQRLYTPGLKREITQQLQIVGMTPQERSARVQRHLDALL